MFRKAHPVTFPAARRAIRWPPRPRRAALRSPSTRASWSPFQRDVLTQGLVLTIEPIIAERRTAVIKDRDGWTIRTRNGCLAAHYEHTVIITKGAPVVVTAGAM